MIIVLDNMYRYFKKADSFHKIKRKSQNLIYYYFYFSFQFIVQFVFSFSASLLAVWLKCGALILTISSQTAHVVYRIDNK